MALEPCKVCGSLTSTNDEICMICGYPAKGRPKTIWLKWIALILALAIGLPLIIATFQNLVSSETPIQSVPSESK
ncbi:hypothetical protein [Coleofasciculus sp. E2-BRE-01]|uniref:hypothetical protein n=1 Tax=unclassified Coleofasciculus TaxID=2692782 RepID=UPI00330264A6